MMAVQVIPIVSESDIVLARSKGREYARELGFGVANQTRLATAISELTRNVIRYAGKGTCRLYDDSDSQNLRLRVEIEDNGPGIPNVEDAMQKGFTTGEGLGVGLPGTERLVSVMRIDTKPGLTKVTVEINQRRKT